MGCINVHVVVVHGAHIAHAGQPQPPPMHIIGRTACCTASSPPMHAPMEAPPCIMCSCRRLACATHAPPHVASALCPSPPHVVMWPPPTALPLMHHRMCLPRCSPRT